MIHDRAHYAHALCTMHYQRTSYIRANVVLVSVPCVILHPTPHAPDGGVPLTLARPPNDVHPTPEPPVLTRHREAAVVASHHVPEGDARHGGHRRQHQHCAWSVTECAATVLKTARHQCTIRIDEEAVGSPSSRHRARVQAVAPVALQQEKDPPLTPAGGDDGSHLPASAALRRGSLLHDRRGPRGGQGGP
eukprot:scaffold10887_cov109-Isochrysis_galbana.AAC.7